MLRAHISAAECTQKHDHYLKGSIYCGQCGSRLIIHHSRSHTDMIYPHFICAGRNAGRTNCTRKALLITRVEQLVIHRDRLERKRGQDKILELHFADAIDVAQFKRHQDRITAQLDDTNRRLCNLAFFTKIYIDHNDELQAELTRTFTILLDSTADAPIRSMGPASQEERKQGRHPRSSCRG